MVQKSRTASIIVGILLRVALFCVVVVSAAYTSPTSLEILKNQLSYQTPNGFFGFTLADAFVSLDLGLVFLSGIFFGALGRKWDYLMIILITIWGFIDYFGTETTTLSMYAGLIGAAVIGNTAGFALKLLRQRFLPKWKV